MSLSLRDIAIKVLKGELPPLADGELARERIKMCEQCIQYRKHIRTCNMCGCLLDIKTKFLEATCPIDLW
jgi:hypothetical protein